MILSDNAKSVRIANLIEDARWAGPQKRITLVSAALKKHQIETVVLLPTQDSDRFQSALDEAGVASKGLPLHRLGRGWKTLLIYVLSFFSDVWAIYQELRLGNYDAVHISGGAWQFKGVIAGRLSGTKVIWHLNDTRMPAPLVFVFKRLGGLVNGFFVAAKRVKAYYIDGTSLASIPLWVIPAPVNTSLYSAHFILPDEQIAKLPFPRIVCVGNIGPLKGIETLIDAAAILRHKLDAAAILQHKLDVFSVVVVGPIYPTQAHYYEQLWKRVQEYSLEKHVHFVGAKEHVPTVLKCADLYVCSSIAEASPMAVWEAMSMGCAIVSTDVGDVAEYVREGESGIIVSVGDAQAMADGIALLLADEQLRQQLGQGAREIACQEFDIKIIAAKTAAAYAALIDKVIHPN